MAANGAGNTADGGGQEQRLSVSIDRIGARGGDRRYQLIDAGEAFA